MAKIRIYTDTNADLCREQLDIECLLMCTVQDGDVTPADPDFTAWGSCHAYYELLRAGNRITTTQVPVNDFRTAFTAAIEQGDTVIYIANALPLSSSVNTAAVVARELMQTHPDAKIYCIDSKNVCWGEGMLVMLAAHEVVTRLRTHTLDKVKQVLDGYENRSFILPDGSYDLTVNIVPFRQVCLEYGLKLDNTFQVVNGFAL